MRGRARMSGFCHVEGKLLLRVSCTSGCAQVVAAPFQARCTQSEYQADPDSPPAPTGTPGRRCTTRGWRCCWRRCGGRRTQERSPTCPSRPRPTARRPLRSRPRRRPPATWHPTSEAAAVSGCTCAPAPCDCTLTSGQPKTPTGAGHAYSQGAHRGEEQVHKACHIRGVFSVLGFPATRASQALHPAWVA